MTVKKNNKKVKTDTSKKSKPRRQIHSFDFCQSNEYSAENCRDLMSENYLGVPRFF